VLHSWTYSSPTGTSERVGPLHHVLPDLAFGVTLFFGLSGFLLYRPFAAAILRRGQVLSFSRYLKNRALRILPAYWVILLVCALVLQSVLYRREGELLNGGLFDVGLLTRSALFLQDYGPGSTLTGIGPAWSLAVEVIFYLALPLLVLLAWGLARRFSTRSGRRLALLVPPLLMLVVGLSGKAAAAWLVPTANPYAGWDANWHSVVERSFWCQADLFAFGMALAILRVDWEDGLLKLPRGWRKVAVAGALGGYVVTAKMTYVDEQLSYSLYNTLMALAFALLLAVVVLPRAGAQPSPLLRMLELRPLVWLGIVSYSIFLWHEPLIRWMNAHGLVVAGDAGFFVNTLALAAFTFALSAVTYYCVEAPALRLKFRPSRAESADKDIPRGELPPPEIARTGA
jgi:peptidoglycan/LPS O-acetylase OafA/YrhL